MAADVHSRSSSSDSCRAGCSGGTSGAVSSGDSNTRDDDAPGGNRGNGNLRLCSQSAVRFCFVRRSLGDSDYVGHYRNSSYGVVTANSVMVDLYKNCHSGHYYYYYQYLYRRVCVYPSKHIYVAVCGPIGTKFGTHTHADSPRKGSGQNKNLPRVT